MRNRQQVSFSNRESPPRNHTKQLQFQVMDSRLERVLKDTVSFLKDDLEGEDLSYDCQLKKESIIKRIQHVWNETKYDVSYD